MYTRYAYITYTSLFLQHSTSTKLEGQAGQLG